MIKKITLFGEKKPSKNFLRAIKSQRDLINLHKWVLKKDLNARNEIINSNQKEVISIARKFALNEQDLVDYINAGNLGFIRALETFDLNIKVKICTYAQYYIRQFIKEYKRNNYSTFKIGTTVAERRLIPSFNTIKKKLGLNLNEFIKPYHAEVISKELNIKPKQVFDYEKKLYSSDIPLIGEDTEGNIIDNSIGSFFANEYNEEICPYKSLEKKQIKNSSRAILKKIFLKLDEREKKIILLKHLSEKNYTFKKIGKMINESASRTQQIEKKAKLKILNFCKKNNFHDLILEK